MNKHSSYDLFPKRSKKVFSHTKQGGQMGTKSVKITVGCFLKCLQAKARVDGAAAML